MSWLGRERSAAQVLPPRSRIEADLSGSVINGQVAIGEHIVQIHAESGAVVNYVEPERRPVPRLRTGPVRRLPRDFPGLLGREHEVSIGRELCSAGEAVEFFGPQGVGKTALLRHLAHRLSGGQATTVLFTWCGRQPVSDLQQFVFECLYECDTPLVPTPSELVGYLQDRRAVVVLDDVGLDRSELERLMDTAPASVFLCSSETRRLWGEGRAIELPGLAPAAVVALVEREVGHPLDADGRANAELLASRFHGHPLAILQSLTELGGWSAAGGPPAGIGARAAGALIEVLGALPGVPIPTADLAAVTGLASAAAELAELEARHLVQSHSPRYSLTGGGPPTDGSAAFWRERLLAHYLLGLEPPAEPSARAARAELAAPPILALLDWAHTEGRPADVVALARAADATLALGGRWGAWGAALDHALVAARRLGDRAGEAWALHQLGSRALCLGDRAAALAALSTALELRQAIGDGPGSALTRHNLELLGGGGAVPPRGPARPRLPSPAWMVLAAGLAIAVSLVLALTLGGHSPTPPTPVADKPGAPPPPPGQPATLVIVSAPSLTRSSGGQVPASFTATYANLPAGETAPATPATCSSPGHTGSPAGRYPIACSGAAGPRERFEYRGGELTITGAPTPPTQARLVVTAPTVTLTYGSPIPSFTPTYDGPAGAVAPSSPATCETTASTGTGPGTYPITCSGAADPGYTVTYVAGLLTITPASLTVQAPSLSIVQGQSPPRILTPSYQGAVDGAAPVTPAMCSTGATVDSQPGDYAITCDGASDPNYSITYRSGTLTISPAPTVNQGLR